MISRHAWLGERPMRYKRIEQLGIQTDISHPSIEGVHASELERVLTKSQLKKFDELFGCQTCGENGMYVYDVEAVLERMMSGKVTGTQLYWD